MGRPCIIEDCENIVADKSRLDACSLCRASINRWKKRSAAAIYNRRKNLHRYDSRLEPLVADDVEKLKPGKAQREALQNDKLIHVTRALVRPKKRGG